MPVKNIAYGVARLALRLLFKMIDGVLSKI